MADFAQNLVRVRTQKNISQETLSRKSGVSQAAISMIEKGQRSPSEQTMNLLANALRVPLSDLLQDNEKKPASETDRLKEEITDLLLDLPEDDLNQMLEYAAFLKSRREKP